jgi:hypothetical protein
MSACDLGGSPAGTIAAFILLREPKFVGCYRSFACLAAHVGVRLQLVQEKCKAVEI